MFPPLVHISDKLRCAIIIKMFVNLYLLLLLLVKIGYSIKDDASA